MLSSTCDCGAQEPQTPGSKGGEESMRFKQDQVYTLRLPGFGMTIPILTSKDQKENYVGQVVAIRGPVGNSKIPHIIGIEVNGGHKLPDAFAIGMLAKFVTTKDEWDYQRHPVGVAGAFGPGTKYTLYSSTSGSIAKAKAWGTGQTKDRSQITGSQRTTREESSNSTKKPKRTKTSKGRSKG